jgi:dihydroxy-acid dehydratase
VCEALGMALPGSAPVAALSKKMLGHLRQAGACIVDMVWQDYKPREIITAGAVQNAVCVVLSLSGSIN